MNLKPARLRTDWLSLAFGLMALGAGVSIGLLAPNTASSLGLLAVVVVLCAVVGILVRIEWGLLALAVMTYIRLSDVLVHSHSLPSTAQPFVVLLLVAVFIRWHLYGERPEGWQRAALLILAYGLLGFSALLYAADTVRAQDALVDYAKDAIIGIVVVLLLRRAATLRHMIWALLAAGIFMGTISMVQQLTGSFDNNFMGFGQAEVQNIVGQTSDYRVAGPIGDPNFYAQVLLVLVPLALDRLWSEPRRPLRLLAAWALAACTLTVVFTFSRGGFLGLVIVLAVMFVRRPPRPLALLLTVMIAIPLLQLMPAQYTDRLRTLLDFLPGAGGAAREEISFRGRLSENTAGWMMFSDHPILGVGLNNYPVYYQQYSRQLGLDPRRESRTAHSLYLQIAAEQGLVGLAVFGLIVWSMFRGMRQAHAGFASIGLRDHARMVAAFSAGLIGYLSAATFLDTSYPRYFWLLFGIAMAMPEVARREADAQREAEYGS